MTNYINKLHPPPVYFINTFILKNFQIIEKKII